MEKTLAKPLSPIPALCRPSIEDVARFNGLQETPDIAPWFGKPLSLWTLTEDLAPAMRKNFTFTRERIESTLAMMAS